MTSQLIAMLAAAGIVTAGVASAEGTRSSAAIPLVMMAQAGGGGECVVNVKRNAAGGVFEVTRSVMRDGSCVCNVVTGKSSVNGAAEDQVSGILSSRSCAEAPLAGDAAVGGASGGGSSLLPVLLGVVGAGGLAAGLGGGGSKG